MTSEFPTATNMLQREFHLISGSTEKRSVGHWWGYVILISIIWLEFQKGSRSYRPNHLPFSCHCIRHSDKAVSLRNCNYFLIPKERKLSKVATVQSYVSSPGHSHRGRKKWAKHKCSSKRKVFKFLYFQTGKSKGGFEYQSSSFTN